MTAKTEIPDWELIERTEGVSHDGMFATVIEVWSHRHVRRFATFTNTRPVLGFKCPTTTQVSLSVDRPQNDYGNLRPPAGDTREKRALACCRQRAWRMNKMKLRGNL